MIKKIDNRGSTLAELMVSFALIGIFMVAAMNVIISAMNIYYQTKSVSMGKQVSDILMTKISGLIEEAQTGSAYGVQDTVIVKTLKITENGNKISFYDGTGSPVTIGTKNGLMNIRYDEVQSGEGDIRYEAVDWTFDEKMYMGYEISELKFSQACKENISYPENILKVELTINNLQYGQYKKVEYVECYHFNEEDYYRISVTE